METSVPSYQFEQHEGNAAIERHSCFPALRKQVTRYELKEKSVCLCCRGKSWADEALES